MTDLRWPSASTVAFDQVKGYELRVSREELRRIYLAEAGRCFDRGERSDLERSLWELAKSTVAATSGVGWPE